MDKEEKLKKELFHLLLRDLKLEISEDQVPFEYQKRVTVKLLYHIDGEWKEITSDFIDISDPQ
jgi:hypothetical protein